MWLWLVGGCGIASEMIEESGRAREEWKSLRCQNEELLIFSVVKGNMKSAV